MDKIKIMLLVTLFFVLLAAFGAASCVLASDYQVAAVSSANLKRDDFEIEEFDYRYLRLISFLRKKDSPLVYYAFDIVNAADMNGIDYRLLVAIAGVESLYGRRMVSESFNAYGWRGGYFFFENWRDSIYYISLKLKSRYYQAGLTDPYLIGRVYAPPNPSWGRSVHWIMREIEKDSLLPQDRFAKLK